MPPFQIRGPRQIGDTARWTPARPKGIRYWIAVGALTLLGFVVVMEWGWTAGLMALLAGLWLQEKFAPGPVDADLPARSTPADADSPKRKGPAWWGGAALLVLLVTYLVFGIRYTLMHPPDHVWGFRAPRDGEADSVMGTAVWAALVGWLCWRLWRYMRRSA